MRVGWLRWRLTDLDDIFPKLYRDTSFLEKGIFWEREVPFKKLKSTLSKSELKA